MGDVVLDARLARGDEDRCTVGPRRIDEPHLAGDVVMCVDHDETARLGDRDVEEESCVRLFVDEHVVRRIVAEPVAEDLARTVVVVEYGVEEGLMVRGPRESSCTPLDDIIETLPRFQILDPQGVELRTVLVDGPGEPPMVPSMAAVADAVVALALGLGQGRGLRVTVEQDLLARGVGVARGVTGGVAALADRGAAGRATRRTPAHHWVLPSFAVAVVVLPLAVPCGDARIVLPDASAELVEERRAKRPGGSEHRFLVGVFRFQAGSDVRTEQGWIAHHLLPVLVLEPGVVVGTMAAVQRRAGNRFAGRDRRFR